MWDEEGVIPSEANGGVEESMKKVCICVICVICGLLALGGREGNPGSTEPARILESPPQQELHLGVGASQVVRGPPSQCVQDLGVEAQEKSFPFAHV